jgi:hypothetical protein
VTPGGALQNQLRKQTGTSVPNRSSGFKLATWPPLTRLWASHISAKPKSMAIERISLRFWPLNLGLLNSHSFGG